MSNQCLLNEHLVPNSDICEVFVKTAVFYGLFYGCVTSNTIIRLASNVHLNVVKTILCFICE
jgi:hypothetical protein